MKKIFIVAGELSGDRTAAWYVQKRMQQEEKPCRWEGIGGSFLQAAGVNLYQHFKILNITGFIEILHHLPRIYFFSRKLLHYVLEQKFDEVILVDFPGFNLRLAKRLKQACPLIRITYVSPPQLWCWGQWRIKKLKQFCDDVVVMYPFEVAWYNQHGLQAQYLGSPVFDELKAYFSLTEKKDPVVALIPGSRYTEVQRLLPLFLDVAKKLHQKYPEIRFVIPIASSLSSKFIQEQIQVCDISLPITLLYGEDEKYKILSVCCLALSKPGTVTLELALLKVPTIIAFKVSRLTFLLARLLAKVSFVGLPNLFLNREIYPEFIQEKCCSGNIFAGVERVCNEFFEDSRKYKMRLDELDQIQQLFLR